MANPNPSPDTRFGGKRGNPNGKTSEQKRLELENAERAMRLREKALIALEEVLEGKEASQVAGIMLDAQALKLLKDSEDRGLGNPVQPHSSPDGSMTPVAIYQLPDNGRDKAD